MVCVCYVWIQTLCVRRVVVGGSTDVSTLGVFHSPYVASLSENTSEMVSIRRTRKLPRREMENPSMDLLMWGFIF